MTEYYNPGTAFRVGSPFGPRTHPVTGAASRHTGQDYPAAANTLIKAAGRGKVVVNRCNSAGYGNYVVLEHLDTTTNSIIHTLYAHMVELSSLAIGTTIEKGSTVGKVGTTGTSTGNHLHFEVRTGNNRGAPFSNTPVNPVSYDISGLTDPDGQVPAATSEQTANTAQSSSDFKFPVCKTDGSEYSTEELYGLLSDENSGHYLLGRHNFWHGGLHFTDEKFPHCVKESPVRSMAKGKVIAYRINKEYPKVSGLLEKAEYLYSTGFCLIQHSYESPEKAPTPQEKMEPWKGKKVTLKTGRNARNIEDVKLIANSDYGLTLPTGTELNIIDIGKTVKGGYYFTKVKVNTNLTGKTKAGSDQNIPSGTELYMATFTPEGEIVTSGVKLFEGDQVKVEPKKHKFNYYSLYMHLCSYNDYLPPTKNEEPKKQIVTVKATNLNARDKTRTATDCKVIGHISILATLEVLETTQTGDITDIRGRIIIGDVKKDGTVVKKSGDEVWIPTKQGNSSFVATPKPPKERSRPCYWEGTATAEVKNANGIVIFKSLENNVLTGQIGTINKGNLFTFETTQKKIIKQNDKDILVAECKAKGPLSFRAAGDPALSSFWTTVDTESSISLQQVEPNQFDKVVACDIAVTAGEVLGYLGLYETPTEKGDKKTKRQVHVELFIAEKTGVDYLLKNPLGLKDGRQFIRLPKDTKLIRQPIAPAAGTAAAANTTTNTTAANAAQTAIAGGAKAAGAANKPAASAVGAPPPTHTVASSNSIFDALDGYISEAKDAIVEKVDQVKEMVREGVNTVQEKGKEIIDGVWGESPTQKTDSTATAQEPLSDYALKYNHAFAIDTLKIEKDAAGKEWYLIATEKQSGRVEKTANSPEIVSQHDWGKLGFQVVQEENDNADGFLDIKAMPAFFQQLYKQMDTNKDGKVDPNELKQALKDPELREQWSKFIALHPTEWRQDTKSIEQRFFDILMGPGKIIADILLEKAKELLDQEVARMKALTFWQDIKPALPQRVYHFHPVAFINQLQAVKSNATAQIIFPLKVKPHNDAQGKWKSYYWAANLADSNASQAIYGRNRDGGARKHAARDLYTDSLAEVVAICDGTVLETRGFYCSTNQVNIQHKTKDGREFIIRYGELDPSSITVKAGDAVEQNKVIGKTGKLLKGGRPLIKIGGEIVYMLHFEYFTGSEGLDVKKSLSNNDRPYMRRKDISDPLSILQEGYTNTFESNNTTSNNTSNKLSEKGRNLLKQIETLRLKPYDDQTGKDITAWVAGATVGYGHLIPRGEWDTYKDGITSSKACTLFDSDLAPFEKAVSDSITISLKENEFDALAIFAYNIGISGFKSSSVVKLVNDPNATTSYSSLDEAWKAWNKSQGKVMNGLNNRRNAELKIYHQSLYESW